MISKSHTIYIFLTLQLNTVWVSCTGENPHDRENIGEINYYPKEHGFPGFYYPYENIPGYLSPVVAVHFVRPTSKLIVINIKYFLMWQEQKTELSILKDDRIQKNLKSR